MEIDIEVLRLLAEKGYSPGENWLLKYIKREHPEDYEKRTGETRE